MLLNGRVVAYLSVAFIATSAVVFAARFKGDDAEIPGVTADGELDFEDEDLNFIGDDEASYKVIVRRNGRAKGKVRGNVTNQLGKRVKVRGEEVCEVLEDEITDLLEIDEDAVNLTRCSYKVKKRGRAKGVARGNVDLTQVLENGA